VKVALYARVSTKEQTAEPQLRELREYCTRRGFNVEGEYVDQVTGDLSGRAARRNRPDHAYRELMEKAKAGKFKCVLVWRYDRFARSLLGLIESLDYFNRHSVQFISLTENIDTTTAQGRLFYSIVGGFAEYEREIIRERVNAGLANAKARGVKLGRRRDLSIEARILKLAARKMPLEDIAQKVKRSRSGVRLVIERAKGAAA
jgi:DNA invertase Pin-like site-specific DNA recombinase